MEIKQTETLHVVPKADVDRMFEFLKDLALDKTIMQRLRGIAYNGTFLAERVTIIDSDSKHDPCHNCELIPFGSSSLDRSEEV